MKIKTIYLILFALFLHLQLNAQDRPWRPPQFSGQEQALGYTPDAFSVPAGMEKQIEFWVKIYSQYGLNNGVIHDSDNIDLIYEVVDFNPIDKNITLTDKQKSKERKQLVKDAKERALAALKKLQTITTAEGLSDYEKNIWDYFQNITETDKFKNAEENIRFQLGQKDRMENAIYLSGRYLEQMEDLFRAQGLPIELTRLVFVESSFNVLARSKVGASGLWQIMRYTGRRKLTMNNIVDNRNEPMEATKVAAHLLKANYNILQAWPLAVTGYNHGAVGVKNITEKFKSKNLAELVKRTDIKRRFGFASKNFYACFLAVLEVERNALKYFPTAKWSFPLDHQPVKIAKTLSYKQLLSWFENDILKLQIFNPHIVQHSYRRGVQLPVGTQIYIPSEKLEIAERELNLASDKKELRH